MRNGAGINRADKSAVSIFELWAADFLSPAMRPVMEMDVAEAPILFKQKRFFRAVFILFACTPAYGAVL